MRTRGRFRSTSLFRYSPLVAALAGALTAQDAAAATYVVTQTGDAAGTCTTNCTLRQAIQSANANCGSDPAPVITFNIPGTGPFVISPATSLAFACGSVAMNATVDGTTQPGYQPTTDPNGFNAAGIRIVIDGAALSGGNLLTVNNFPYGSSLTVVGLELRNHASGTALNGNVRLRGSYVHGNAFGMDPFGFSASNRAVVGGGGLANRNLFRANSITAIDISYGGYVDIVDNLVGLDPSGAVPSPNGGEGIVLEGAVDVTIRQNYVAGNNSSGIRVSSTTSTPIIMISQNKIGLTPAGGTAPNSTGVKVDSSDVQVLDNIIAGNDDNGVWVYETFGPSQALISGNAIHSNGIKNINLDFPAADTNDALDADTGPNGRQNRPVITSVLHGGGNTSVAWTLDSEPSQTYALQFFSNPSAGVRAGTTFLGQSANVLTNTGGNVSGVEVIPGLHANISATAIRQSNGHTSEFSPAVAVTATPAVTVSPNPLNFPGTVVGSSSGPSAITVTSTGAAPYVISQLDSAPSCYGGPICAAGPFSCSTTCTPGTPYAASASCGFSVTFTPPATGPHSTTFYLCDNASGSPRAVTLSGIGITAPPPTIAPTSHDFGSIEVGGTSAAQAFTVNNPSPTSITLSAFSVTGPYQVISNTCGATLAATTSCTVNARFAPAAAGPASGVLSATASTGPVSANLTGNGTPSPAPTLTPPSLDFGAVQVGGQSGTGTFTVANPALLPVSLSTFTVTPPFTLVSSTCAASLAPGGSCTADVRFAPATVGAASGSISNATGRGNVSSTLAGNGTASPPSTITPVNHDFGPVFVGTTSAPRRFTISNPALLPVSLSPFSVTPPFSLASTTCTSSLPAGASCTADVTFAPAAAGPATGSITNSTGNGPVSASLAGTGTPVPPATIAPAAFDFGSVLVGTTSATASFTVNNPGPLPMALSPFAVTPPFNLAATTCGVSLPAGSSCTAGVRFAPSIFGAASGSISATAGSGTISASLAGTGAQPALLLITPAAFDFGSVLLGSSSASRQFLVKNPGANAATLSAPSVSGPFQLVSTTCGSTLAANASCDANVRFVPTARGPASGALVATSSAGPASAALAGNGVREPGIEIATEAIDFGSLIAGDPAVSRTVRLTSSGNDILGIYGIQVGAPFRLVNGCGVSIAPGDSCTLTVGFEPIEAGDFNATLVVNTNVPNAPSVQIRVRAQVQLRPEPRVRASPRTVAFGRQVGGTSAPRTITITNEGGLPANLNLVLASQQFVVVNTNCAATLPPQRSCTTDVAFQPQGYGPRNGAYVVTSNSPDSPIRVELTGVGCRPVPGTQGRGTAPNNCSP